MPIIRDLLARFRFDVETSKLEKLERQLDAIKDRIGLIASIEVVRALYDVSERFAHMGVNLRTAALSAGTTVESFQELAISANAFGIEQQQMETGLFRISQKLHDARQGSAEAQEAFSKVGFTPDQVKGFRNSQEVLLALGDRFKQIPDPIQRAAAASELLGRGSMHMVAWLSQGSKAMREEMEEARRLGLVLRTDQIQAMVKLENSLSKVYQLFKVFAGSIAADVAPVISFLVSKFMDLYAANRDILATNVEGWLLFVIDKFSFLAGIVYGLTIRMINLAKAFNIENSLGATTAELLAWTAAAWGASKAITVLFGIMGAFNGALALTAIKIGAIALALHEIVALYRTLVHGDKDNTFIGRGVNTLLGADWGKVMELGAPTSAAQSIASSNTFGPTTANNNFSNTFNPTFNGGNTSEQLQSFESFVAQRQDRERREAARSIPVTPLR